MGNLRDKFSDEEWEKLIKQIEKEEQESVRNKVNI